MPHGAPDWYRYRRDSATFPIDDLAELAARLDSIVTFDRRGDVLFLETFEHSLTRWTITVDTDGAGITITPATFRSRGYSAKLTTGDTANDSAQIAHTIPYPNLSRFGLEASFTSNNTLTRIAFGFTLYDGTTRHMAHVRYRPATDILEFYNPSGLWTTFATDLDLYVHTKHFHTIKLVCDFPHHTYSRVILNDTTYDLTPYAYLTGDDPTLPRLEVIIETRTSANSNQTIYLDDIIVTQDEP